MMKAIYRTLLASILFLFLVVSSVNAQDASNRLVGLSSDNPAVLHSIDPATGAATPIQTLNGGASATGLSFISGTLFATDLFNFPGSVSDEDIGSISRNGTITFLGDQNGSDNWWGLASDDCDNRILYSIDNDDDKNFILTAQFLDGSVETIGAGTGIEDVSGMAYDDENNILYAIGKNTDALYTVSTEDGTSTFIGSLGIDINTRSGLAYDEISKILYANDGESEQLYIVDITTGQVSLVGSNGVDTPIDGLAWLDTCPVVRPIPTLSEWGLIAMAGVLEIISLLAIRRRKVKLN